MNCLAAVNFLLCDFQACGLLYELLVCSVKKNQNSIHSFHRWWTQWWHLFCNPCGASILLSLAKEPSTPEFSGLIVYNGALLLTILQLRLGLAGQIFCSSLHMFGLKYQIWPVHSHAWLLSWSGRAPLPKASLGFLPAWWPQGNQTRLFTLCHNSGF